MLVVQEPPALAGGHAVGILGAEAQGRGAPAVGNAQHEAAGAGKESGEGVAGHWAEVESFAGGVGV